MKVYVASHDRLAACQVAGVLEAKGHEIVSRWHSQEFLPTETYNLVQRQAIAHRDFDDVKACDALVLIAGPGKYSGGKFVEAGIAIGLNKRVVVVGRRENMLMWLMTVECVDTPEEVFE